MKVFGRVAYALLAVFAFWFAIDYARGNMTFEYFENEGNEAILLNDDSFFYGSARDYNQKSALYEVSQSGYTISIYEIADVRLINEQLDIQSYAYIILKSEQTLGSVYTMQLLQGTQVIEVEFLRFRTLNIMMGLNETMTEFGITKELILSEPFEQIRLLDHERNVIFTQIFELNDSDFIIEPLITTYYQTHDALPLTELVDQDIYPSFTHTLDDYLFIMRNSVIVYFAVLGVSIYVIFFMKKKFLGKKKPSEILVKEQSKYKKSGL